MWTFLIFSLGISVGWVLSIAFELNTILDGRPYEEGYEGDPVPPYSTYGRFEQ